MSRKRKLFIAPEKRREYVRYIVPSMLTFTITSIFGIVDGLFVGNTVGDAGLAAISVAWPIVQVALALGTGIGMGGAVISSISKGEGDEKKSVRAMGSTLTCLFFVSIPLTVLVLVFGPWLMGPMGAQGETFVQAGYYIRAVGWSMPACVIGLGAVPIIRNRGCVKTAMVITIFAGTVNIILDYVFVVVLNWGTAGAGWATTIGESLGLVWGLGLFCTKKYREVLHNLKPDWKIIRHAIRLGVAPCGLSLLPELTVVVTNINANAVGGETAVAAFAVISYVMVIVELMIQGVSDGSQPLISLARGQGDFDSMKRIRSTNYLITSVIGVVGVVLMTVFRYLIPEVFGASETTIELIAFALPIYTCSYLLYAFTHPSTSYFYATDDARASNSMVYGEVILVVVLVTGMAHGIGLTGIWFSPIAVQACLAVLAVFLLRRADARDAKGVGIVPDVADTDDDADAGNQRSFS